MTMGGKGRSAGHEMYTGMTPTQEFNARLANASDYYTPAALRTSNTSARPETQAPVAPSPVEGDTIAPVMDGQASVGKLTTTQDTGDTLGKTITASTWQDQLNQATPGGAGSLKLTGQV